MEDLRVSDEKTLMYDEIIGPGEDDDVAVDKGEISVSDELELVVGHDDEQHSWEFRLCSLQIPPATSSTPSSFTMAEIARLIPGAAPPVAQSKSQRKKRKTGAKSKTPGSPAEGSVTIPDDPSPAIVDSTPNETDIKEDNAHELVAASEAPTHDDLNPKSSAVIELVQKRMRSLNKKIVCFFVPLSSLKACVINSDDFTTVPDRKLCSNRL